MKIRVLLFCLSFFVSAQVFAELKKDEKFVSDSFVHLVFTAETNWEKVEKIGLDLDQGTQKSGADESVADWDILFRKTLVTVRMGYSAAVEKSFEEVLVAPSEESFKANRIFSPGGSIPADEYSEEFLKWFGYAWYKPWLGHLFWPEKRTIVFKTLDGRYGKVQGMGYVKNGESICNGSKVKASDINCNSYVQSIGDSNDGKVHILFKYKLNRASGDTKLE